MLNLGNVYGDQRNMAAVHNTLTLMFEIDRDLTVDVGLHLPHAPIRLLRVAHECARFQKHI